LFGGRLRSTSLDQEDNDDDEELLLDFIIGRITKDYIKNTKTKNLVG
jgi:hypothetical protein